MLISRQQKIVFIHIRKTGGKSVRALLRQYMPAREIGGYHAGVDKAIARLGNRFQQYYSFAFVRNPWDRLVSLWGNRAAKQPRLASLYDYDFGTFIRKQFQTDHACRPMTTLLCDSLGGVLVNDIYRFENFASECHRLLEHLGFPNIVIPNRNSRPHPHYSTFYTDELEAIVANQYARDIAVFGYTFERQT